MEDSIKFIPLEDVLFPKDKLKCYHIALDETFMPIKHQDRLIGCIMRCANCGKFVKYHCRSCGVGALEVDPETEEAFPVLPCDLKENEGFVKGLKKFDSLINNWR